MAKVRIPSLMRDLTGGSAEVEADGATLGEVLERLSAEYPGFRARLMKDGRIKPGVVLSVDGRISLLGMHERVSPDARILILQTAGGG